MIQCKICNKVFKSITNSHLKKYHNIEAIEYKKLYGDMCSLETNLKKSKLLKNRTYVDLFGENAQVEKNKRSVGNIGKILSEETKLKLRTQNIGKKHPHKESTKIKIGLSNKIALRGRKIPKEVILKRLETCKNRGIIIGSWNKGKKTSEATKAKQRNAVINKIEAGIGKAWNNFNPKEIVFFKRFDELNNTKGIYAPTQYKIKELGYFLDYINFKEKLIIEYDEKHHYTTSGELRLKDKIRQKNIQSFYPDFKFIRIRE